MNKNDIFKMTIETVSAEGVGIGKIDGFAVFVPKTAPGDIINCKIVKMKKNYAFGIADEIIEKSSHRIESDCEVFGKCGGCVYRHIDYDLESKIKEDKVKETVARIGGYKNFDAQEICSAQNRNSYRNKAQIPLGTDNDGNLIMGFYGKHSHRIVDCKKCPLQPDDFNLVMDIFRKWHNTSKVSIYNEINHKGILRHLYIRKAENNKELMVCLVATKRRIDKIDLLVEMLKEALPNFKTLVVNINKDDTNVVLGNHCFNIFGDGYITDKLCGLEFRISPLSFYQVNASQAQKLYNKAKELASLEKGQTLVDLYCGTGTIGLSLTDDTHNLIGVEIVPQAVEDAKVNAEINKRKNANFICADAVLAKEILEKENIKPDVIVFDPPRKGLDKELIKTVTTMNAKKLVYISCDVATLARDLVVFKEEGYELKYLQAFDLFPGTPHVESICLMTK